MSSAAVSSTSSPSTALPAARPHSLFEDLAALVIGTLLVSFALALYKQSGLLTGSTAGLAFLIHYKTQLPFGATFFVINMPFYWLSLRRMGLAFTLKTMAAVGLISAFAELHSRYLTVAQLEPFYVAPLGGVLMGVGLLVLFRHKASLGGVSILSVYLQERYGFAAGKFQMIVDLCIMLAALFVVGTPALIASIVGVTALNLVVAMNHRPGRYVAG